jgi:hypothetical protein
MGISFDAEPMKKRSEGAMIKAYQALWSPKLLHPESTVKLKTHILDNQASGKFKREIQIRIAQSS